MLGSKKLRVAITIGIASVFVIFLIVQSQDSFFKNRYTTMLEKYDVQFSTDSLNAQNTWNSLNMRKATWTTAISLIKEEPVLGRGTGDDEQARLEEYRKNGFHFGRLQNFNEHNQYLGVLVRFGIIGLIIFLTPFAIGIYRALQTKDALYLFFLLLVMLSMLTENYFESDRGVIFYALINSILFFSMPVNKSKPIVSEIGY